MSRHSKKFLFFLMAVVILGSLIYIYSALKTAKAYTFFAPFNAFVGDKIVEPIKKAVVTGKVGVENKFKKASAELIGETVEGAKNNIFASVKNGLNSGLDAIGKTIGVDEKIINQNQEVNQKTENNQNCK